MAGLLDFLFGAGPLKTVAGVPPVDKNYVPGSVDTAKANEDYAAKRLATAKAAKAKPAAPPAVESSPGYDWKADKRNAK